MHTTIAAEVTGTANTVTLAANTGKIGTVNVAQLVITFTAFLELIIMVLPHIVPVFKMEKDVLEPIVEKSTISCE